MSQQPGAHGNDPNYDVFVVKTDGSNLHRLSLQLGMFADWGA